MICDLKKDDEEGRLSALGRLDVLDSSEEAPFESIVTLVQNLLQVPICAVSLVDRNRQWFKARRGLGVCETSREVSFCAHAIRGVEPFIIRNAEEDPRFADNPLVTGEPFIRSYAGIPLMTPDGYNIGSLCAIDTKPREFPAPEIDILTNFANLVVGELELRQIATTDLLTGALSRSAWVKKAHAQLGHAQLEGSPVSVALIDIDGLRTINDRIGWSAGNRVLRELAGICMSMQFGSDLFGRFGGDEFVLAMPGVTLEQATYRAEEMRELVQDTKFIFGNGAECTVSIGVAECTPSDDDPMVALQRAAGALAVAKSGGPNRVATSEAMVAKTGQSAA